MKEEMSSNYNLEFFFAANRDLQAILTEHGVFSKTNASWQTLLGYDISELIHQNFESFVHTEDLESTMDCLEAANSGIIVFNFINRMKAKNGKYLYINWHCQPIKGFLCMYGTNVTELQLEEDNLQHSQRRLAALLASQNTYIIRFTTDFVYSFVNNKYTEDFAWLFDTKELVGKNCKDSLREEYKLLVREICAQCIANPNKSYQIEIQELTNNNIEKYTVWELRALCDEKGKAIEIQGIGVDITERKLLAIAEKAAQNKFLMELSTPIAQLWEGILLLPLVGIMSEQRILNIAQTALKTIAKTQAKFLILDINGIPNIDENICNQLIKLVKSSKLMGCCCLISGITAEISKNILNLNIKSENINSKGNMQEALKEAFAYTNTILTPIHQL